MKFEKNGVAVFYRVAAECCSFGLENSQIRTHLSSSPIFALASG
jgi:hypothetical protein